MTYQKTNNLLGWFCFAAAAITFTLTLEPSVSFWDCGEFISCAFKLQVSHPAGLPHVCYAWQGVFAFIVRQ